jgi:YHS domain-containing protein
LHDSAAYQKRFALPSKTELIMNRYKGILYVGLMFFSFFSNGQTSEVFVTDEGAIRGYDPVAYFTEERPVKGSKQFNFEFKGVTWLFASEDNLKAFQSNPEKYIPQYGGYCAYGMSRGYKAQTEPDAWTIAEGKLYLNYNTEVKKIWREKQREYVQKADLNWPVVKDKKMK